METKAKCYWCHNDATKVDYREIDGITGKKPSCDKCFELSTSYLLKREYDDHVKHLRTELKKYQDAYDILMDNFDYIPEEERPEVDEQLNELGL